MFSKLAVVSALTLVSVCVAQPVANLIATYPDCNIKIVNAGTKSSLRAYSIDSAIFLPAVTSDPDNSQFWQLLPADGHNWYYIQSTVDYGFAAASNNGTIVTSRKAVAWAINEVDTGVYVIKSPNEDTFWAPDVEQFYKRTIHLEGPDGTTEQRWYVNVECD
ncbi:hypothetical protein BDZ89DRAFT_1070677 [Hymenopellis radicata]|nr:hypothetical protein BDZ89DRAFT_1070677 [Hymenopellis radicata]